MDDKSSADTTQVPVPIPISNGNGIVNKRKPQSITHSKFLSHSVPNTTFIKNETMDNKLLKGDEDINSNPANDPMKQNGSNPAPDVIKGADNSLEVSLNLENNPEGNSGKCSSRGQDAGPIIMGHDHDRSNRVDILWRVAEGKPASTDASVSSCVMHSEPIMTKFQQTRSRVIPQFQQKRPQKNWGVDEVGQGSQTRINDPNENAVLLGKKSDDDQGDHSRNDGAMYPMQPNEPERKLRREPLTWPWHSGSYQMNFRFHTPEFRTLFSSKIIIMKSLQWVFATVWTYVAYDISYFREHQNDLTWTLYLAIFFLMTTFLTVRSTSFVENQTSIVVQIIYTLCIAHISAMLHIHYDCSIIPIVLITMAMTYILSAVTFSCIQIDADSPLVFYPIFVYVIMTSVVAFWFVLAFKNTTIQNPLGKMITVWFPCCLMAMIVCSLEMLEIQALLRGTRMPLEPNDWILATTYLL